MTAERALLTCGICFDCLGRQLNDTGRVLGQQFDSFELNMTRMLILLQQVTKNMLRPRYWLDRRQCDVMQRCRKNIIHNQHPLGVQHI
jgi:hypothetical protein